MFTEHFQFRKINVHKFNREYQSIWHNYSFKGRRKRYIVIAEEFNYSVYAVKFYLQEHKSCAHKFSNLSAQNEGSKVLTTVGKIMLDILHSNPYASFIFVGSPSKSEKQKNTKRYRLYSKVVSNVVSPVRFEHHTAKNYSAYLLLNRDNNEQDILRKIEEMFKPFYQYEPTIGVG